MLFRSRRGGGGKASNWITPGTLVLLGERMWSETTTSNGIIQKGTKNTKGEIRSDLLEIYTSKEAKWLEQHREVPPDVSNTILQMDSSTVYSAMVGGPVSAANYDPEFAFVFQEEEDIIPPPQTIADNKRKNNGVVGNKPVVPTPSSTTTDKDDDDDIFV